MTTPEQPTEETVVVRYMTELSNWGRWGQG